MIGRYAAARAASIPMAVGYYGQAPVAGLGALGQPAAVSCPSCGTQVPLGQAAVPSPVAVAAALANSVTSMTLAGLLTHFVSKRLLGW